MSRFPLPLLQCDDGGDASLAVFSLPIGKRRSFQCWRGWRRNWNLARKSHDPINHCMMESCNGYWMRTGGTCHRYRLIGLWEGGGRSTPPSRSDVLVVPGKGGPHIVSSAPPDAPVFPLSGVGRVNSHPPQIRNRIRIAVFPSHAIDYDFCYPCPPRLA